ncbi:MAG: dihydroorotase [Syntrophobacterales bacterium]|nr:dihydroorotase [Syntrophobacterales bacterium]
MPRWACSIKEAPKVSVVFQNVRLIDPSTNRDEEADVVITNGLIGDILRPMGYRPSSEKAIPVLSCNGSWFVPGLVDMHVHLREPGEEYKETIASGTRAAVAGGFVAVACMPNTKPPNDSYTVTRFIVDKAAREGASIVYPVGAITKGLLGEELTEMGSLVEAGVVAFSDDGRPVMNAQVMRRAMEYSLIFSVPIISHCEDLQLSAGGVANEGMISLKLGLRGLPSIAEEVMVARDIMIAKWTGARLHIAHVSTKYSVELIRRAKREGLPITAETAPHYFTLTEEALQGYDAVYKVNPPLRTLEDVEAVVEGLSDGTIDAIATDHAPHSVLEKDVEFDNAAFGMIGLETALPLSLELVRKGILSPLRAIALLSTNPARILGISLGSIEIGKPAFATLIDPNHEWVVNPDEFFSISRNCPFKGWSLRGRVQMTIVDGSLVFMDTDGICAPLGNIYAPRS